MPASSGSQLPRDVESLPQPVLALIDKLPEPPVSVTEITAIRSSRRGTWRLEFASAPPLKARILPPDTSIGFLRTVLPLLPEGQFSQLIDSSSTATLEEWVEGRSLVDCEHTPELLQQCGRLLGRVHRTSGPGVSGWQTSVRCLNWFEADLLRLLLSDFFDLQVARRIHEFAVPHRPAKAEFGITHREFCPENLLLHNGRVCSIDNMLLAARPLDEDLARLWYRWDPAPEDWSHLMTGYSEFRDVSEFHEQFPFWISLVLVHTMIARCKLDDVATARKLEQQLLAIAETSPEDRRRLLKTDAPPADTVPGADCSSTLADPARLPLPHQGNAEAEPRATGLIEAWGEATRVTCPPDDLAWLREFLEPSLSFDSALSATRHVELQVDQSRYDSRLRILDSRPREELECFTLDGKFESFPGCTTDEGGLLLHLDRFRLLLEVCPLRRDIQLVAAAPAARVRLGLMRVIREVATVAALRAGAIPFHGAACVDEGRAFCLLGAKQAGKTTSLIHLLQEDHRRFLANDRFFVQETAAGLEVRGMPTIVKVRSGTLGLFEGLAGQATATPWHRERTLNEVRTQPGRPSATAEAVSFSQAQFLEIMQRSASRDAPLSWVLFPERDDRATGVEFRPIATAEAASLLAKNLLSPGTVLKTSAVFDSAASREIPPADILRMCRLIAAQVPCVRYRQGAQTISLPFRTPPRLRTA